MKKLTIIFFLLIFTITSGNLHPFQSLIQENKILEKPTSETRKEKKNSEDEPAISKFLGMTIISFEGYFAGALAGLIGFAVFADEGMVEDYRTYYMLKTVSYSAGLGAFLGTHLAGSSVYKEKHYIGTFLGALLPVIWADMVLLKKPEPVNNSYIVYKNDYFLPVTFFGSIIGSVFGFYVSKWLDIKPILRENSVSMAFNMNHKSAGFLFLKKY